MTSRRTHRSSGFTLAELAVALAIIALLLFGAMVPFSTQVDLRNIAETQRSMDSIREAILGFALANGRLPCPADGNIAFGSPNAGVERFDGTNCVAALGSGAFGVVPWATLGTPETDAWGRRFAYRVSPAFADAISRTTWNSLAGAYSVPAPPPTYLPQQTSSPPSPGSQNAASLCNLTTAPLQSSFALCTLGDITVYTRGSPGTAATPTVAVAPAVLISHGKNGYGAWQPSGVQLPLPPAGSDDEAANANGNTTQSPAPVAPSYLTWAFYSRTPTPSASGCADPVPTAAGSSTTAFCEFDDIVVAIPANALIGRMVAAGKLP
ncbi:MAG TPA: type II secretion system protein [Burkholderiales bacterium]|nr:type II secretion system protein [Burkholderiales bacterium]HYA46271.1 type II secretion system protein [Burkholderiales bacterium]